MKRTSLFAIAAAAATAFGASAQAADLGGDCCADLEERVAELEATTARKGNRKVSLTVSGQVNELVYWWDDGVESNVYIGTSGYSSSRFRFKGDAKINDEWSAGYYMEIEVVSAQVQALTADLDDGPASANAVKLRQSNWFLKSKRLGTITVGQQSHATDDIILYSLAGTGISSGNNHNVAPGAGIGFRNAAGVTTGFTSAGLFQFIDSDRANLIRYDSPTVMGFVLSASWGEDDMWDVAVRYAGEFNGIKIAGGIGYHEERDATGDDGTPNVSVNGFGALDFNDIRGSVSVLHEPTGLFVDFAALHREYDDSALVPGALGKGDFNFWLVRAGLWRKFFPIGKTALFGEYAQADGAFDGGVTSNVGGAAGRLITESEGTTYGIGVIQSIDAAAMELYAGWRHFEADVTAAGAAIPLDDLETVYMGARIQF